MIGAYVLTGVSFAALLAWGWLRGRCRCLTKWTVLKVNPDDIVVLSVAEDLTSEEAEHLARSWQETTRLPNRPVVLTGDVSVGAVRAATGGVVEHPVVPERDDIEVVVPPGDSRALAESVLRELQRRQRSNLRVDL